MNPFSCNIEKSCLFNKSTNTEVASLLLNVESIGLKAHEKFIEKYIEGTTRFEKPIKHNKFIHSQMAIQHFKLQGKDKEIIATSLIYMVPYYLFILNNESTWGRF